MNTEAVQKLLTLPSSALLLRSFPWKRADLHMKSLNSGCLLKGTRTLFTGKPRPLKEVRVHIMAPRKCEKCEGNDNFPSQSTDGELPPFWATSFFTLRTQHLPCTTRASPHAANSLSWSTRNTSQRENGKPENGKPDHTASESLEQDGTLILTLCQTSCRPG